MVDDNKNGLNEVKNLYQSLVEERLVFTMTNHSALVQAKL